MFSLVRSNSEDSVASSSEDIDISIKRITSNRFIIPLPFYFSHFKNKCTMITYDAQLIRQIIIRDIPARLLHFRSEADSKPQIRFKGKAQVNEEAEHTQ
jgi:hypothetical protein